MKVILEQDVAKIGTRGSIVDVPNGYAMNQLIPKGMAKPATGSTLKQAEVRSEQLAKKDATDEQNFHEVAAQLKAAEVTVNADANDDGGLFKAVSPEDIAAAAQASGVSVDAAQIIVGAPIKEVGEHEVALVRKGDQHEFTITVIKNQ